MVELAMTDWEGDCFLRVEKIRARHVLPLHAITLLVQMCSRALLFLIQ